MRGYEELEHTADVLIRAYGDNLNEAFEEAAKAMFSVMTDIKTILPKEKKRIEIESEDYYSLLYDWLEELLILFGSEALVFSKFEIKNIQKINEKISLIAEVWGEIFDISCHPQKTEVKAITYAQMEITQTEEGMVVQFVLDI